MHAHEHRGTEGQHHPGRPARTPAPLSEQRLLDLQRSAGNSGVAALVQEERSPVLDVLAAGGGRALDEPVRAEMEARLGHRFDDVRVHTGPAADASARAVDASAFTVGSDVVFQQGRYDPTSTGGRTLLAHELTHVVQQRSGPVDGTPAGGGIQVSDPGDRFEREAAATAERAMSAPGPAALSAAAGEGPAVLSAAAGVQRSTEAVEPEQEELAAVQGHFGPGAGLDQCGA